MNKAISYVLWGAGILGGLYGLHRLRRWYLEALSTARANLAASMVSAAEASPIERLVAVVRKGIEDGVSRHTSIALALALGAELGIPLPFSEQERAQLRQVAQLFPRDLVLPAARRAAEATDAATLKESVAVLSTLDDDAWERILRSPQFRDALALVERVYPITGVRPVRLEG